VIRKKGRARKPAAVKKAALAVKPGIPKAAVTGFKVLKFPYGTIQIQKDILIDLSCLFPVRPVKIIVIKDGQAVPEKMKLHHGYLPDRVMWFNKDKKGYTLEFADWPFNGPKGSICVPAGGYSGVFTVLASEPTGAHSYDIVGGPPGGPEIEVVP